MDARDWFVLGVVTAIWLAGTAYLFLYPSPEVFAAWGALATTMIGAYHWLVIKDSKEADA
jgi:hypothetical protein